jgi:hypothetical protein
MCRNHTDEGICGESQRISFCGKVPSEAISRAYEYVVNNRREESYVGEPDIT